MQLTIVLAVAALFAFAESSRKLSSNDGEHLTYPLDGMKEFKIEVDGKGECINSEAKISPCEDPTAKMTWRWAGNSLENVGTNECLIFKDGVLTVGSCTMTLTKQIKRDLASCSDYLAWEKNSYLVATGNGDFSTVSSKGSKFNIYRGKASEEYKIMICVLKYDIGQRTNDPQYYYFKNEQFKITWQTKYVKLFVVFDKTVYDYYVKLYGSRADEEIKASIQGSISMLDKEYRQINIRILLAGYEVWKDARPILDTDIYNDQKMSFRNYSYNHLRKNHVFDGSIFFQSGVWKKPDGTRFGIGGAGMSDICSVTSLRTEMFVMAAGGKSAVSIYNLISHEFGHQIFQGHNFEPKIPCPFYRMFGTKCTMGGNDDPKGFSSNIFKALQRRENENLIQCVNAKPNLQQIQSPQLCGNGIRDPGEECDCGSSANCLTADPCCDGMTCQLKAGAQCSSEQCCSKCKMQTTGPCSGPVETLTKVSGRISSDATAFNVHRHWHIIANPGEKIAIIPTIKKGLTMDFHINCAYDYIEIRDGGSQSFALIGKYCNSKKIPRLIKSSTNELFITFHADMSFASLFELKYYVLHPDSDLKGSFSISMTSGRAWRKVVACNSKSHTTGCGLRTRTMLIKNAVYGIFKDTCGNGKSTDACDGLSVTSIMKTKCEGIRTCKYTVDSSEFGNHCPGIDKALQFYYACIDSSVPAKQLCLNYNDESKSLKFELITPLAPCQKQFEWLDNNVLRHIGSNMCVHLDGKLTHNCYSSSSAFVKLRNGGVMPVRNIHDKCLQNKAGQLGVGVGCTIAEEFRFA